MFYNVLTIFVNKHGQFKLASSNDKAVGFFWRINLSQKIESSLTFKNYLISTWMEPNPEDDHVNVHTFPNSPMFTLYVIVFILAKLYVLCYISNINCLI